MIPRIPKRNQDLRRLVLRTAVSRILGYAVWITLLYLGARSYNQNHQTYPPNRLIIGWKMAVWIGIAVVSGFFLFRIWKFFTERAFSGTIERYSHSRSYSASDESKALGTDHDFRLNTVLRVRTHDGRLRRIRFEQKNGFYGYYHEGAHIARLRGLPYPVNLDPDGKDGYVCSACGTHTKDAQNFCVSCDRSIVHPEDIITKE